MNCPLCGTRKPRRFCPAQQSEICTVCCGTGREETIDCPLGCEYLRDAHRHEKAPGAGIAAAPNRDIEVKEEFVQENQILLAFLAVALFEGSGKVAGATDWDVRDALEALVKTWRTLASGIVYEARPENALAASIASHVQREIEKVRNEEREKHGTQSLPDAAVLTMLAFLQRLEYTQNNGRRRSRAFLDFLGSFYLPPEETGPVITSDSEGLLIQP